MDGEGTWLDGVSPHQKGFGGLDGVSPHQKGFGGLGGVSPHRGSAVVRVGGSAQPQVGGGWPRWRGLILVVLAWGGMLTVRTPAATTPAAEPFGWRLGVAAWSYNRFTLFESIEKTAALGLRYVESFEGQRVGLDAETTLKAELPFETVALIHDCLRSADVTLTSIYIHELPGDPAACRRQFAFARQLGVETIISEPEPEALDLVERLAVEFGINVALHNHPKGSSRYWHPREVLRALEGRSMRLGACADVGHWQRSGIDPVEGVRLLGRRLMSLHVKDLNVAGPDGHDVPWGTGQGKIASLLREVRRLGARPTLFAIEYEHNWGKNDEEVGKCAAFFRETVGVLAAAALSPGRNASRMGFRAGAHEVDISPERLPVIVNAMFTERSADKVVDRLFAKALALDDGETCVILCVVDTCMMPRELMDRAKTLVSATTSVPVERMLVSATHTHSAPSAMGCLGSRVDLDYAAALPAKIASAMEGAFRNLAPARIGWGEVEDWEHTFNRRWIRRPDRLLTDPFGQPNVRAHMHPGHESPDAIAPSGPVDPDLTVLAVQSLEGRPLAVFANYSQHYYESPLLSSDYYGRFAQHLASRLEVIESGEGASATQGTHEPGGARFRRAQQLFGAEWLGGASPHGKDQLLGSVDAQRIAAPSGQEPRTAGFPAGASPTGRSAVRPQGSGPPFVAIMSQGTSGDLMWMDYGSPRRDIGYDAYAQEMVERTLRAYRGIEWHDWVPLRMAESTLALRYRVPSAERLAWARDLAKQVGDRLPRTLPEIYAFEALHLDARRQTELKLQALRLGDLGIAAIPNEVFAITGLKLKALSPLQPTFNVSLANGAEGYIPPPEQHPLGGYTTWPARTAGLEVEAEPRLVETLVRLLEEVSGKPRRDLVTQDGPYAEAVLRPRPLAYWRCEEMVAPRARDRVGRGADGTYETGVALFLPGPGSGDGRLPAPQLAGSAFSGLAINRAAHFAGGRMRAPAFDLSASYTVSLWVWNGLPTDARPVTGYFYSRGPDGDAALGEHLGIGGTHEPAQSGRLILFNGNQRNQVLVGRSVLGLRQWHHVVLVREERLVRVYLDGKPDLVGELEAAFPGPAPGLFFGGRSDNFANFEGRLDEVALYGIALSAGEVARQFAAAGIVRPMADDRKGGWLDGVSPHQEGSGGLDGVSAHQAMQE